MSLVLRYSLIATVLVLASTVTSRSDVFAQTPGTCLSQGQTVTGVLTRESRTHPGNGAQLSAYVLKLPTTRCAVDEFFGRGTYGVQNIHLVKQDTDSLSRLVGQTIAVRLDDMMPSNTAYHFGNAVVFKYAVVTTPVASTSPSNAIEVPMVRSGGTYVVPVSIK